MGKKKKRRSEEVERMEESFRLYGIGWNHYHEKRVELARDYFLASTMLWNDWKPYRFLAMIYAAQGDNEKKFLYLEKAYQASEVQDIVGKEYAEALLEKGHTEQAKSILEKILARNVTYKPGKVLLEKINHLKK